MRTTRHPLPFARNCRVAPGRLLAVIYPGEPDLPVPGPSRMAGTPQWITETLTD
jgi:hypothetical protein